MHRQLSRVGRGHGAAGLGRLFGAAEPKEQIVPLTITRAQRDAIYELVVTHLTGIGDVWVSVDRRDFAAAKRLGARSPRTCGCWRTSAGPRRSTARRSR
jgi:hypothetical protein